MKILRERKITKFLVILFLLVFVLCVFVGCENVRQSKNKSGESSTKKTIRISGAWALYPMMVVWADEYQKSCDIDIEVAGGGAGKGMSDVLNAQVDIAMCSRPLREEELAQGAFYLAVVKDAVVATISSKNPVKDEIFAQGLSREDLENIFTKEVTHWGELVNKDIKDDKIIVYGRSDASGAAKVWASFLGDYSQSDLQKNADANFNGDQPLAQGVKNDPNTIGFNNLNYAYSIETGEFADNISPVPLDLNNDNLLNEEEDFYSLRSEFVANVSAENYPSPPARRDFIVVKGSFNGEVKKFAHWILTDGQKFVTDNGYVKLSEKELEDEISFLNRGKRK